MDKIKRKGLKQLLLFEKKFLGLSIATSHTYIPVIAFIKVDMDRLSILKKGSLTGNCSEPHNTVCSRM